MMRSVDTYRKLAAAQASRRVLGVLCAALVALCAVTAHLEWRTQPTSVIAQSGPPPGLPYYNVADFPGSDAGQKIMACTVFKWTGNSTDPLSTLTNVT